jgi:hypothetical protein
MSFIDASYFVGDLTIPNTDEPAVLQRLTWFIQKNEPVFLQKLMGYPLYKAFLAGINVVSPAVPNIKWLNILYGAEYTDFQGYIQKWKGLIVTDIPIYNLSGGYVYKAPQYLTAGVTIGLTPGATTATFDGTGGKDDWRGWIPVLTRTGIMRPGVDYSWDTTTGQLALLKPNDKFGNAEDFFVAFQLRTDATVPIIDMAVNESCIANYIYYKYRRDGATQYTGIGEVITTAENSTAVSPRKKAATIWNEMHCWVKEFLAFMEATQMADPTIYPEWTFNNRNDAYRYFGFMNPFF